MLYHILKKKISKKGGIEAMLGFRRTPRTTINFTEDELNVVINSLIEWKNQLIREGRYTDAIDDLLLKILD